jgi:cytochrome o ubiquinol oxidase subunit 3
MNEHAHDKVTFGFWVYLMSDCILFASLFATFAVLRGHTFGGPAGSDLFSLPFAFGETLILLTSSFFCGLAILAAHYGKQKLALVGLVGTVVLGLAFLTMEMTEFTQFIHEGHGWQESAFLSSFFALVGTHGFHVFLGSIWMIVLLFFIAKDGLTTSHKRKLMCLSLFWHFLDVVWIFIFTFVYLFAFL